MNKRICKKQRERARRDSAERYRQNPTADALIEHYERFGEVLTPLPEDVQKAIDAALLRIYRSLWNRSSNTLVADHEEAADDSDTDLGR